MASSFSGKAGRKAANDAEKYIGLFRQDLISRTGGAQKQGRKDVAAGTKALNTQYGRALGDLQQYYPQQQGYLDQARGAYDFIGNEANAGTTMLSNSLGLHGAEGGATALEAFRGANPGYEFQRNQAEDSVMRRANAGGMLASGNMLTALSDRTQGLADQTYGSWQDRLAPYMAMSGHVADARANISGQQANAAGAMGTNMAGLRTGLGDKLLQAGEFNAQQGQGYNTALNAGLLDLGSQQTAAHTSGMMAGQQAAQNRMGALMGGLNLAGQIGMGFAGLPVAGSAPGVAGGSLGGNFLAGIFK